MQSNTIDSICSGKPFLLEELKEVFTLRGKEVARILGEILFHTPQLDKKRDKDYNSLIKWGTNSRSPRVRGSYTV